MKSAVNQSVGDDRRISVPEEVSALIFEGFNIRSLGRKNQLGPVVEGRNQ